MFTWTENWLEIRWLIFFQSDGNIINR